MLFDSFLDNWPQCSLCEKEDINPSVPKRLHKIEDDLTKVAEMEMIADREESVA